MQEDPDQYWEERGGASFTYRGETFYTITPIGFYLCRRERLLRLLDESVSTLPKGASILDFGCGDGFYTRHLAHRRPDLRLFGCDISGSMIERARSAAHEAGCDARFEHTEGPIPFEGRFDRILVFAVLAHVPEGEPTERIVRDLAAHLLPSGRLLVFEGTSLRPRRGEGWRQPVPGFYRDLFAQHGLVCASETHVRFPSWQWFGRFAVHAATLALHGGDGVRANGDPFCQRLSARMVEPVPGLDSLIPCGRGNTLYELKRQR